MSERPADVKSDPSRTAQLGAAHRAYHLMRASPPILEDSDAIWLLGQPLRAILRFGPLRRLLWEPLLAKVRPISTFIVVRSRFAEDQLEQAISDGCSQYMILGAGLDSWALRNAPPGVRVFELDRPATQRRKRDRILARLGQFPPHLTLIPIDFERQTIGDTLCDSPFDRDATAFVSWLGTLYYLTRKAIEATLDSLAAACTAGSQLASDYFVPKSAMSSADLELFRVLDEGGTRRGEPMRTLLEPGEVAGMLRQAGFRVIEDLSADAIRDRYLSGRSDGLDIPDFGRLCLAERE